MKNYMKFYMWTKLRNKQNHHDITENSTIQKDRKKRNDRLQGILQICDLKFTFSCYLKLPGADHYTKRN